MKRGDIALHKAELTARRARLPVEQRALFEKRLRGESTEQVRAIPRRLEQSPVPLSYNQQRLWFLNQWDPHNAAYNLFTAVRIGGQLDVTMLHQCLDEIIRRHEVLRTTFAAVDGSPVQIIAPALAMTLPVVDLQELPEADRRVEAQRLTTEEIQKPFDLTTGPLVRCTLLRLDDKDHVTLLTMHHIVSDAWSMGIFLQEIAVLWHAYATGNPSPLLELPIQYADFAVWQREWLQGETLETQLAYWQRQMAGAPPLLTLPTDRPRPPVQTSRGGITFFHLDHDLSQRIKAFSQRSGATLFMILEAAFVALLSRYSGQDDIVIGTPIINRGRPEIEPLIGFFISTLVLRNDLSGNPTFEEWLDRVRQVVLQAHEHKDLTFEMLVEELQPERDLSHNPLFTVTFAFEYVPIQVPEPPGLSTSPWKMSGAAAIFDLALSLTETEGKLSGTLVYNTDLFKASTMTRMAGHFQTLLESAIASPEQHISDLQLLTEAERRQLLVEWNGARAAVFEDSCVHALFETQVEQTPDAVVTAFQDQHLTWEKLNRRANQLAHYLQELGIGPNVPVGICVEHSLEMLVGILGILKAGGSYISLDPLCPKERLALVIEDAQVTVFLTLQRFAGRLAGREVRVLCLDREWEAIARQSTGNPASGVMAGNLARVIYTSQLLGKLKGILMAHREMCHSAETQIQAFNARSGDRVFQFARLDDEMAVPGAFVSLLSGATLYLETQDSMLVEPALIRVLQDQAITTAILPSSLLVGLTIEDLPELRTIITMGEICPANILARWEAGRQLYNVYGSDKTTVWDVSDKGVGSTQRPIVGRPLANTQVYLLDAHLQPVPVGVPGELYIGGSGLAQGYLNQPELTADRLIPHPFSDKPGERLFKSGDLACYRSDGTIEFVGPADSQVRVRGRHVEPGQIETVLGQHPFVRETVVVAHEDVSGTPLSFSPSTMHGANQYLTAYVVPNREEASTVVDALRSFLKRRLPDYMVPSAFMVLDALPLAPSGRVDLQALPLPGEIESVSGGSAQMSGEGSAQDKISQRRDELATRQARLSSVKQALLAKRLQSVQEK
jgi:amino acid adenylation domain-containing protein